MNFRVTGIIILLFGMIFMQCKYLNRSSTNETDAWTNENTARWMQDCVEVTASEFEDNKGNNFSQESAKIYCDCNFADLQERNITPKNVGSYINTPEWRQMSDRCYAKVPEIEVPGTN